jgi:hypothetical protein
VGALFGAVTNAASAPIEGARVAVLTLAEPPALLGCQQTRADGTYSFPTLPPGDVLVIIDPPAGAAVDVGSSGGILRSGQLGQRDWVLGAAGIAGTITVDGAPTPEVASACLRPMNLTRSMVGVDRCGIAIPRADGTTRFALDTTGFDLSTYQLMVSVRGTDSIIDFVPIPAQADRLSMVVDLASPRPYATCPVSSLASGNLAGRVVDASGQPVEGARVELLDPNIYPSATYGCVRTDTHGRYVIDTTTYAPELLPKAPPGGTEVDPWYDSRNWAKCSAGQSMGCLPDDRTYLMIVDPPSGAPATMGSTGGQVVANRDGAIYDWTLGQADLGGTISLAGDENAEAMTACLRLESPAVTTSSILMARCGRVISRSDGSRSWAIDTDGAETSSSDVLVEFRGFYNLRTDWLTVPTSPSGRLDISYDFDVSQGGGNGCPARERPNVTGKVTSPTGEGVRTLVTWQWRRGSSGLAYLDAGEPIWSATDGTFKLCAPNFGPVPPGFTSTLFVHAASPSAPIAGGNSVSLDTAQQSCTSQVPCVLNVQLSAPALSVVVSGASGEPLRRSSVQVQRAVPNGFDPLFATLTDDNGRLAIGTLADGSYRLQFQPPWACVDDRPCVAQSAGYVPLYASFTVAAGTVTLGTGFASGTPASATATMRKANTMIEVREPGGTAIEWPSAVFVQDVAECAGQPQCGSWRFAQMTSSRAVIDLPNGSWVGTITGNARYGDAQVRVVVEAGRVTSVSGVRGSATLSGDTVVVTLPEFPLVLRTVDAAGAVVPIPYINTMGASNWVTNRSLGGGRFGVNVRTSGLVTVTLESPEQGMWGLPQWNESWQTLTRTTVLLRVTIDSGGAVTKLERCGPPPPGSMPGSTTCVDAVELTKSGDHYDIAYDVANVVGRICLPATGPTCTPAMFASVQLDRWTNFSANFVTSFGVGASGTFKFGVRPAGRYDLTIRPPWNGSLLLPIRVGLLVTDDGAGGTQMWLCPGGTAVRCEAGMAGLTELTASAGVVDLGSFVLRESPLKGTVRTPAGVPDGKVDGEVVEWTQIAIEEETATGGWTQVAWVNTDQAGRFALDLAPGKIYRATAQPRSMGATGSSLVASRTRFRVSGSGDDRYFEVPATAPATGWVRVAALDLRLALPNVVGTAVLPDGVTPVAGTSVNVERYNSSGWWDWQTIWATTDSTGTLRLGLEDGEWRITARVPSGRSGDFSDGRVIVTIADGVVTKLDGASCAPSCSPQIRLVPATLRGVVLGVDGLALPNASLNVNRFDSTGPAGSFSAYSQSDQSGRFGMAPPSSGTTTPNRYELRVGPPYGMDGVVQTTWFIGVYTEGGQDKVCRLASRDINAPCLASPAPWNAGQSFDLQLDRPNVSGVVSYEGTPVTAAWIEVSRQSSWGGWEYITSSNVRSNGRYGVKLDVGTYRVRAVPPQQTGSLEGAAATTMFVRVKSDGSFCVDPNIEPLAGCTTQPSADIALAGANVRGTVVGEDGSAVPGGWVSAQRWNGAAGYWEWIEGASSNQAGRFAISLARGSRYRITVNPPNGGTGPALAARSFTFHVGDFQPGGRLDDLCFAETTGGCSDLTQVVQAGALRNFELSAGNLRGTLKDPQGVAVSSQWISVERRVSSMGTQMWTWSDVSTNSRFDGSFGFQLDPGQYRISAEAPTALRGTSPRLVREVTITSTGWCNGLVECLSPNASSAPLELAYATSNVRARANVPGLAWGSVALERFNSDGAQNASWMPACTDGSAGTEDTRLRDDMWHCWSYADSAWFDASGLFAFQLPAGTYRLRIQTSGVNGASARYPAVITVGNDGGVTFVPGQSHSVEAGGRLVLSPPPPTITGRLSSSADQPSALPNAWIGVERWNGSWWTWVDSGTSTATGAASGLFNLTLPRPSGGAAPYKYRIRFYAPNGTLATFARDVLVDDQGRYSFDLDPASATWRTAGELWEVAFPTPNVSGVVTSPDAAPVRDAWIGVQRWNAGGWWEWADTSVNTTQSGMYGFRLDDGLYRLDVRAPWGAEYSAFFEYIDVSAAGVQRCDSTRLCVGARSTTVDLRFPTPTIKGVLKDVTGDAVVRNAWMPLQQWVPNGTGGGSWQWTERVAYTNNAGRFAITVPAGRWRMEVNAPSATGNVGRFSVYFTVDAEQRWCPAIPSGECRDGSSFSTAELELRLRTANLVGRVFDGEDAGSPVPSRSSWISLYDADGYLGSTYTDVNGTFRFNVEPGVYTLYAYPNWSTSTSPYSTVRVEVGSDGAIANWSYTGPVTGPGVGALDLQLQRIEPTVRGVVSVNGTLTKGVFVTARTVVGGTVSSTVFASTVSGQGGSYGLVLPAGSYQLTFTSVNADGTVDSVTESVDVSDPPGGPLVVDPCVGVCSPASP